MANNLSLMRTDRMTGSRIAGALGISPFRTRGDVMREMVREHFFYDSEFDGNFVTEWGSEHEPEGVDDYELLTGNVVVYRGEEQRTMIGGPGGIFAVTPDGLVIPKGSNRPTRVLEVKCPWRALYTDWREVPYYEVQIRLLLEVTGLEWGDMAVWRQAGTNISTIHRDIDREGNAYPKGWLNSKLSPDGETLISEIERFLEEYAGIIDRDEDDPVVQAYLEGIPGYRYDQEWLMAAATYLEMRAEVARIQLAENDAKRQLEQLAGTSSAKGGGVHVVYSKPRGGGKGTVSWKTLATTELSKAGVEITEELQDLYRSAPSAGGGRGTYSFRILDDK